jgi:hypothetical protein
MQILQPAAAQFQQQAMLLTNSSPAVRKLSISLSSKSDLELGELTTTSNHNVHRQSTSSNSSSSSNSPNSHLNLTISSDNQLHYNYTYLLKQMNKRKLHLPCPLCDSLVVNMSDHLAKTHMIVDFKQRKVLLNQVRNTHIMNPSGLRQLIDNNKYLLEKLKFKKEEDEAEKEVNEEEKNGRMIECGVEVEVVTTTTTTATNTNEGRVESGERSSPPSLQLMLLPPPPPPPQQQQPQQSSSSVIDDSNNSSSSSSCSSSGNESGGESKSVQSEASSFEQKLEAIKAMFLMASGNANMAAAISANMTPESDFDQYSEESESSNSE